MSERSEVLLCYPVIKELRTPLSVEDFLSIYDSASALEGYQLIAVKDNEEIIALMGYRFLHDFVHGKHLYIDDLVTLENRRSEGIGADLLKYAESIAAKNNCKGLRLCTGIENDRGKNFYDRNGWHLRAVVYKKKLTS